MKYSRMFFFFVLMTAAVASFGAYDGTKPADNEYVADVPALVRENFRAVVEDAIVNAGALSGYSVGSASGNIPRSNGTLNTNLNSDLLDGYHASAFNASDALNLRLDGSRYSTGFQRWNGNYGIAQSTSDGADTGSLLGSGGGYTSGNLYDRAAAWILYGNEYSTIGGQARYYAGNVSTGDHVFYTGNSTERFRIGYDGMLTAGGNLKFGGNYGIMQSTTSGSDTGWVAIAGGGAVGQARGGTIYVVGVNHTNQSGQIQYFAGNAALGDHRFYTGSGVERMRITYGGNVLIGTTTDNGTNKLQVNGGIKGATLTTTGAGVIGGDLTVTGASTNFRNAIKAVDGNGSGVDADSVDTYHAQISAANGTIPVRDSSDGHINITGSNVNGAAYVVTTGSGNSAVYGLNNSSGGIGAEGRSDGASGVGLYGMANGTSGIGVKGVGPSGGYDFYASGAGTDYGTSSSIRWKKNRRPIANALGIVDKLEGIRFTWDKEHGGIPGVGFIAEEVGKYLPEIVVWDAKAPGYADGMDYSKMTPLLLQAIKELNKQRKSDNAALLRKIEKQEREINELRDEMRVMRSLFEDAVGDKADYDRMDGQHLGAYIQTN